MAANVFRKEKSFARQKGNKKMGGKKERKVFFYFYIILTLLAHSEKSRIFASFYKYFTPWIFFRYCEMPEFFFFFSVLSRDQWENPRPPDRDQDLRELREGLSGHLGQAAQSPEAGSTPLDPEAALGGPRQQPKAPRGQCRGHGQESRVRHGQMNKPRATNLIAFKFNFSFRSLSFSRIAGWCKLVHKWVL